MRVLQTLGDLGLALFCLGEVFGRLFPRTARALARDAKRASACTRWRDQWLVLLGRG